MAAVVKWETLPLAMSIAAFCNEGIVILTPSTRNSMRRPSEFLSVSGWSIVFFTICYMAVGLCGNIRYAGDVKSQLSLNFNTGGGWGDAEHLRKYTPPMLIVKCWHLAAHRSHAAVASDAVTCSF